jgi:predicted RNase H-like HicB family nuclease
VTHYLAIVEDAGPDRAVGVWFPDLPGCFSAGDSVEEAMLNAPVAVAAYAEALADDGRPMPSPRRLDDLLHDPTVVSDLETHLVALIEVQLPAGVAA